MNNIKLKESDIRKQLQDYLRWHGWHVHYNLQGLGSYRGVSDLTCIKGGRVVWLEVKTPTGKQREDQKMFQAEVEAAGGEYVLACCIEDLKEAVM
jgi:Holliday junction resolvase